MKKALAWAVEPQTEGVVVRRNGARWWIAVAAALVIGVAAAWTVAHLRQPVADDRVFRFPLNLPEGGQLILGTNRGGIALSPDGKSAAFFASVMGKTGLWVQTLDGSAPRLIPGTETGTAPFWSPDSKAIAFFSDLAALERVDVTGSGLLTICATPALARGGTWIQDDQIIFGTLGNGLFRVSSSGGVPVALTKLDTVHGETGHGWPQLLPHGQVMYWAQTNQVETTGVYIASLSGSSQPIRLVASDSNALYVPGSGGKDYLLWRRGANLVAQDFDPATLKLSSEVFALAEAVSTPTAAGRLNASVSSSVLLYSASNSLTQLTWFDRTGTRVAPVGAMGDYSGFRLSPDGRRAAVSLNGSGGPDLWILDLDRGVSTRFTSRHGNNLFPVWSPDGGTILFQSSPTEIFRKETRGTSAEQRVRQFALTSGPLDWSRDGRSVLYFEIAPATSRDLMVLSVTPDGSPAAGSQPVPYVRTQFNEWHGRFSPEPSPKWVAYQSNESGRFEIYIDSFPSPGNKVRVSTDGGQYPQWGPGARELFYVSADYRLMSVSLNVGSGAVEPSPPRPLFLLPAVDDGLSEPYEAAPDGQRFLVRATPQSPATQALTVLVNWPALLRSRPAAR